MKQRGTGFLLSLGLGLFCVTEHLCAENLTTLGGVTYTDIVITKVESDGIRISHSGGAARIPAAQLPALFKQQHALSHLTSSTTPAHELPQTIVTLDGKTYNKAIVRRVDPDRIFIIYEEGATTLYFTNLPEDVQKKYGFDPLKALEAAQKRAVEEQARVNALLQAQRTTATPAVTASPRPVATAVAPVAAPAPAPVAPASTAAAAAPAESTGGPTLVDPTAVDPNKNVTLLDLVQLSESIDLIREEERSRLGGTVNWRPADDTYYYWYYDYYWGQKYHENRARTAKQSVANGARSTWTAAVVQARELLKRPAEIPPIKAWLEKFIRTAELAGTKQRDDYHRRCKELIDDLDFLLKADAKS